MDEGRVWARIDTAAAAENYRRLRAATREGTKVCCVVKANAYGHGALPLARIWEKAGADMFAVATADEAFALREGGITSPCLILGYAPPSLAKRLYRESILPCLFSTEEAAAWEDAAAAAGVRLPLHIKLETGMGRLGLPTDRSLLQSLRHISRMRHLLPVGIFTHFARADEGKGGDGMTARQYRRFTCGAAMAEDIFGHSLLRHCANTGAILDHPEVHADMVRAGIGLYGYSPSAQLRHPVPLQPVMQFGARVVQVREVNRGASIGYGGDCTAKKALRVAVLSAGYADGVGRDWGAHGVAPHIGGRACPILGRVCMDACMVDVSEAAVPVSAGDEGIFFGDSPAIGADELARKTGTISYEILCRVGARVPRMYQ